MTPDPSAEIRDLARGVRAISCIFSVIVSYFNIFVAFKIGAFEMIFADMLGGKPLPIISSLVCQGRYGFMALSLALPLGAILAVCLIRSHRTALTIVGVAMAASLVQLLFTWSALTSPLMSIISGMAEQS